MNPYQVSKNCFTLNDHCLSLALDKYFSHHLFMPPSCKDKDRKASHGLPSKYKHNSPQIMGSQVLLHMHIFSLCYRLCVTLLQ